MADRPQQSPAPRPDGVPIRDVASAPAGRHSPAGETAGDAETRLLDAAEAVFAERGYGAATTSAIARRAGLNKAAIHYYFRSKEGLYRAVVARIARRHVVFLEDLACEDPVEALARATRRYVRLLADHPHFVRLCAYAALEGMDMPGDEELERELMTAFEDALRRGVAQGVLRPEDPRHLMASVEGMCRFFFEHEDSMRRHWGTPFDRRQVVEERAEHIVRLLLYGLDPARVAPTPGEGGPR